MRKIVQFSLAAVCLLCVTRTSAQAIYFVTPSGTGTGSSWTDASGDLQAMMDRADSGDQVWVASGTYKPERLPGSTGTLSARDVSFVIRDGVAVYGGFAGTEALLSERNLAANTTTLSGDLGVADDLSDNAHHVVIALNVNSGTLLDGFTITGGNANLSGSVSMEGYDVLRTSGAGLYLTDCQLLLRNVIIADNHCVGTVATQANGGGIYMRESNLVIEHSEISDNSALVGDNASGGTSAGVFATGTTTFRSKLTMRDVLVKGNIAQSSSGGVRLQSNTDGDFMDVRFIENKSSSTAGALYVGGLSATNFNDFVMKGGEFRGNSSVAAGGAVYVWSFLNYHFHDLVFTGNQSASAGGAVFLFSGGGTAAPNDKAMISNSLFFDNKSTGTTLGGGAVFVSNGTKATIVNNTFFANSARFDGGAIGVFSNAVVDADISNCIFFGNTAQGANADFYIGALATSTLAHSITQLQGVHGINGVQVGVDPQFISVDPTHSAFLTLAHTSPAVDAGDNSKVPAGVETDLAGNPRIVHQVVDLGPYEYFSPTPVTLSSFSAVEKAGRVELSWVTETEQNTNLFEIERSGGGAEYKKIGVVQASGNTASVRYYNYTDDIPLQGMNQYRLKSLDYDGTFQYSKVVPVFIAAGKSWAVSPSPAYSVIKISGPFAGTTHLRLFDHSGKEVRHEIVQTNSSSTNLQVHTLPPGVYHLHIHSSSGTAVKTFLKK